MSDVAKPAGDGSTVLKVQDLAVQYELAQGGWLRKPPRILKAVEGVSFELERGETLGVVGESGCGKSTLARAILGLVKPSRGRVLWLGEDLTLLDEEAMRKKRKELQIIFQDPLASLNPRMTVGDIIAEPLRTFYPKFARVQVEERVRGMMKMVGLLPNQINRYPHEFSGGQCQRIGIARALVLNPKLIICDEPVSALDVSIQAQIINLLKELQKKLQSVADLHRPRSGRGAAHQRPGDGDVPGAGHGSGRSRCGIPQTAAPLYQCPDSCGAGARPENRPAAA